MGLATHCGVSWPEHTRSTPLATQAARAMGAHTPAATTHSHSTNTEVMALRDKGRVRAANMRIILGSHIGTGMGSKTDSA